MTSGTTVYGTGQSGTIWQGGTISSGATLRLDDGATVSSGSGNPFVSGTLQFNETTPLTLSSTIQGAGTLSLTNTGTLTLTGSTSGLALALDLTTNVSSGTLALLQAGSFGAGLWVGDTGTGALNMSGGFVKDNSSILGNNAASVGTATISSGTWANSVGLNVGEYGTGTLNVNGGTVTSVNGNIGRAGGSVGTATVSSGTWAISNSLTIGSLNNSSGTLNVTGGSVIGGDGTLGSSAGSVGTATVSSGTWALSSSLTVGSSGTGTLTMSGGLVTVGGTLSSGTAGTINLNAGGTLQIGTGGTNGVLLGGTGSLANNGTLIFNRSNASTYSGSLSGSGAVTKLGGGTLTLSGSNSYTGLTSINSGMIALGNTNALAGGGTISFGGGTLQYSASNTADYSSRILSSGSAIAIDTNSQNAAFASSLGSSNTGGLTKIGLGKLTLSGSNSYTGTTTISSGVLALGNTNALAGGGRISFGGGTLQYSASNTADYSARILSSSGAIAIDTNGQDVTFASSMGSSNLGGLTKIGLGTLTLSAANTYPNLTTVSGGTLAYGISNALHNGAVTVNGGVLNLSTFSDSVSAVNLTSGTIAGTGTLTSTSGFYMAGTGLASASLAGGVALNKVGAGTTTTLTGSNSYTGTTGIAFGVLNIQNGNALGTSAGATTVSNSAALQLQGAITVTGEALTLTGSGVSNSGALRNISGNNTWAGTVTLAAATRINSDADLLTLNTGTITGAGFALTAGGSGNTMISSLIGTGNGTLTKDGSGTLTLSGSNSYTGLTNINGGILALGNTSALAGGGTISFGGGTLQYSASNTADYSGRILSSGSAIAIDTNGQDVGFATSLASSNTGGLTKAGTGMLSLTGSNTYSGVTTVSAGTLSIGSGSTTGSVAGDIVDNATLAFNRSDALTYAGAISGSGAVTKLGSGVLTLTGSNSYTGVTTVSAGELKVNGSTGTGALTVASAAILSGTGTIGGATTISGTHMPGNSPGIQSFTSDLTYAQVGLTGPKIFWELAGNTTSNSPLAYDQIDVGGNLNFGAGTGLTLAFGGPGSTVSWSNSFWSHWQQWTFYNVSGTTSGVSNLLLSANDWRDSNNVLLSSVRSGYTFEILQIGEDVVIEFVPEPSTYALAVIGLGVAGLRQLKKRRAARAARLRAAA